MSSLSTWQNLHEQASTWDLAFSAQAKIIAAVLIAGGVPERDPDLNFVLRQIGLFHRMHFVTLSHGGEIHVVWN